MRVVLISIVVILTFVKLVGAESNLFIAYNPTSIQEVSEIPYFAEGEVFPRSIPQILRRRGIQEVIGTGKSSFTNSTKNRLQNIDVAVNRFNGVIIPRGKTFSFNKILNSVHPKYGYVPDTIIKGGRIVYAQGGGVCQLSTTIFRAALSAGLEIEAQRNHSMAVPYYKPYGLESAIYMPYLDLKFKNNTPGDILLQTFMEGNELVVVFLGTSDGRKVSLKGPFYSKYAMSVEDLEGVESGDPYAGGYDYRGFSVQWVWRVENGEVKEEVLTSYYRSGR